MKKIVLLTALSMAGFLSAQIDFSSTRYGITAGGNYSRVSNAHNPSGPLYTFQAGFMALIPLDQDDQFYIQPELVYFGAGESGKDKDAKGMDGYNAKYANNYISLPIYFKGYFSEAESEFFGLIGPRIGYLISQKVQNAPANRPYYYPDVKDPDFPEISGNAKKFSFGIGAGVGFSYKRQLEFSVRYDLGLSNTYPKLVEKWTGDFSSEKKKSEQVLSVGLTYIFLL